MNYMFFFMSNEYRNLLAILLEWFETTNFERKKLYFWVLIKEGKKMV